MDGLGGGEGWGSAPPLQILVQTMLRQLHEHSIALARIEDTLSQLATRQEVAALRNEVQMLVRGRSGGADAYYDPPRVPSASGWSSMGMTPTATAVSPVATVSSSEMENRRDFGWSSLHGSGAQAQTSTPQLVQTASMDNGGGGSPGPISPPGTVGIEPVAVSPVSSGKALHPVVSSPPLLPSSLGTVVDSSTMNQNSLFSGSPFFSREDFRGENFVHRTGEVCTTGGPTAIRPGHPSLRSNQQGDEEPVSHGDPDLEEEEEEHGGTGDDEGVQEEEESEGRHPSDSEVTRVKPSLVTSLRAHQFTKYSGSLTSSKDGVLPVPVLPTSKGEEMAARLEAAFEAARSRHLKRLGDSDGPHPLIPVNEWWDAMLREDPYLDPGCLTPPRDPVGYLRDLHERDIVKLSLAPSNRGSLVLDIRPGKSSVLTHPNHTPKPTSPALPLVPPCALCREAQCEIRFQPCSHQACRKCVQRLRAQLIYKADSDIRCPFCNTTVKGYQEATSDGDNLSEMLARLHPGLAPSPPLGSSGKGVLPLPKQSSRTDAGIIPPNRKPTPPTMPITQGMRPGSRGMILTMGRRR